MGTRGTLKDTRNTQKGQKELEGICVSPGSGRKPQAAVWPERPAEHRQHVPSRDSFNGTLRRASEQRNLVAGSHHTSQKVACVCHHHKMHHVNKMIWVHQIFHNQEQKLLWGSGESKLCEEPQQKGMGVGRGQWKPGRVLTIFLAKMEENTTNY